MSISRRSFIKANAATAAATAAGISIPALKPALAAGKDNIRWDKAPCRFCGTGCSVLVGTQNGRIVATQGDPNAPVNRGLNCIKGVQDSVWERSSAHTVITYDGWKI